MNHARHLRLRLLSAIASSSLLAAAASSCGGNTTSDGGGGASGNSSSGGSTSSGGSIGSGGSTSTGGAAGAAATCSFGNPVEQCFTLDELEAIINSPPQGGDVGDASTDAWTELLDCADKGLVYNTCCNAAQTGPTKLNGECCYVFCEGACCGRPFVVEGTSRVASERTRLDWREAAGPAERPLTGLDDATRGALARIWSMDARMEHASIASFARFTLELLAVGAPAELVDGAQRAGLDEVAHAKLCFALASRYGGGPLGPDKLDVSSALTSTSLADLAAATVREGCIGETVAALMARQQHAVATDPSVSSALERIARDEERHAELAWSFVRWALASGGPEVEQRVRLAFAEGVAAARAEMPAPLDADVDGAAWAAHGRLDVAQTRAVLLDALGEVIEPCCRGLFAPPPRAAAASLA